MTTPTAIIQDVVDRLYSYAETLSQRYFTETRPRGWIGADCLDLDFREFGAPGGFAGPCDMSALSDHVGHVGGLVALKQMGAVAARWVIAAMEGFLVFAEWANLEAICHAVNAFQFSTTDADDSIAVGITKAPPQPASIGPTRLINPRPQPYLQLVPWLPKGTTSRRAETSVASPDLVGACHKCARANLAYSGDQYLVHESIMPDFHARWNRTAWEFLMPSFLDPHRSLRKGAST